MDQKLNQCAITSSHCESQIGLGEWPQVTNKWQIMMMVKSSPEFNYFFGSWIHNNKFRDKVVLKRQLKVNFSHQKEMVIGFYLNCNCDKVILQPKKRDVNFYLSRLDSLTHSTVLF